MIQLDPRITPFRDDIAAAGLQNRVRAAKYVEGEQRQVAAPSVYIRTAPKFDAPIATEALSGELAMVYEIKDGWAWLQLRDDGYVGYTTIDGLSAVVEENSHRISARLTYLYPAPDMKRPPITKMSFSSTVAVVSRPEGRFWELSRGGFVFSDHLVGIRERAKDYVRVAERFVGVPYLWGGKTTLGIDCSGLVQIAMQAAGGRCPRDSDMQREDVGEVVALGDLDSIQRGDLLFWQGHVAIAQSGDWMVHASGHHMEVVVEPIRRAIERIGETHGPLAAIKRPIFEQAAAPPQAVARPNASEGAREGGRNEQIAAQPTPGPAKQPLKPATAHPKAAPAQPPQSSPAPRSPHTPEAKNAGETRSHSTAARSAIETDAKATRQCRAIRSSRKRECGG